MLITPKQKKRLKKFARIQLANSADSLARKAELADTITGLAEGNKVAVVSSGIDCDGTAWRGSVELILATPVALARWADRFYADAEGPQNFELASPSSVTNLTPEFRDLALEAFEAGRPHQLIN